MRDGEIDSATDFCETFVGSVKGVRTGGVQTGAPPSFAYFAKRAGDGDHQEGRGPDIFAHPQWMYIHLLRYGKLPPTETSLHVRQLPPDFADPDPTL